MVRNEIAEKQIRFFNDRIKFYTDKNLSVKLVIEFAFFDLKKEFQTLETSVLADKRLVTLLYGNESIGTKPSFYYAENDRKFKTMFDAIDSKFI